ncbi:MAG: hypothetical protein ACK4TF_10235 [Thermodesulfovibrionales bacterium]
MAGIINICAICAWRATCQKKFSVSGRSMHCPDFVRDVTIKTESSENLEEKEEKKEDESRKA